MGSNGAKAWWKWRHVDGSAGFPASSVPGGHRGHLLCSVLINGPLQWRRALEMLLIEVVVASCMLWVALQARSAFLAILAFCFLICQSRICFLSYSSCHCHTAWKGECSSFAVRKLDTNLLFCFQVDSEKEGSTNKMKQKSAMQHFEVVLAQQNKWRAGLLSVVVSGLMPECSSLVQNRERFFPPWKI